MLLPRLVLALMSQMCAMSAIAQSDLRPVSDEDTRARPVLIVAPAFPERRSADVLPVEIKVVGTVSEKGELTDAKFPGAEGKEKYVQEVQSVLALWRFRPPVPKDTCVPAQGENTLSVWFEEKNGKPTVWVSVPTDPPPNVRGKDGKLERSSRQYAARPRLEFPEMASQVGMEGAAELLMLVNRRGDVLKTTVLYSTPNKIFGEAAIEGSRRVRLEPLAETDTGGETKCYTIQFQFCLAHGIRVEYPNSGCAQSRYSRSR